MSGTLERQGPVSPVARAGSAWCRASERHLTWQAQAGPQTAERFCSKYRTRTALTIFLVFGPSSEDKAKKFYFINFVPILLPGIVGRSQFGALQVFQHVVVEVVKHEASFL